MNRPTVQPQPTVRGLMVLVATVGLVLGAAIYAARVWPVVADRRMRARAEAGQAARWRRIARLSERGLVLVTRLPMTEGWQTNLADRGFDTCRPFHYWYSEFDPDDWGLQPGAPAQGSDGTFGRELTEICVERAQHHERMYWNILRAAWLPWTRLDDSERVPPVEGERIYPQSY